MWPSRSPLCHNLSWSHCIPAGFYLLRFAEGCSSLILMEAAAHRECSPVLTPGVCEHNPRGARLHLHSEWERVQGEKHTAVSFMNILKGPACSWPWLSRVRNSIGLHWIDQKTLFPAACYGGFSNSHFSGLSPGKRQVTLRLFLFAALFLLLCCSVSSSPRISGAKSSIIVAFNL